ncbi:MAG TPA: response regulator transcription factor [Solirubrobacteraceae bacterium]|jgi:DNA-binding NarL/FixJ family response regulator
MPTSFLIVDDHPSFRAAARMMLEAEGFEVVGEAVDGATAISAARRLMPDAVLLDVNLPDTDGFAVAAQLPAGPAIVLTSSRDAREFGPLIERSGARAFVAKADLSGAKLRELLA